MGKGVSDSYGAQTKEHREAIGRWNYVIRLCLCILGGTLGIASQHPIKALLKIEVRTMFANQLYSLLSVKKIGVQREGMGTD